MNASGGSNYHKVGGIVGINISTGIVDQVVYSGQINFSLSSIQVEPYIGGIIGYNFGTLSNAMTKRYSSLNVRNTSTIGGLVGLNAPGGHLKTSVAFGKVLYMDGIIPAGSTFSQTIGSNQGDVEDSTIFLLENNSAGFLGSNQVASCSGNFATVAGTPTYLTAAATTAGVGANLILLDYSSENYSDNRLGFRR